MRSIADFTYLRARGIVFLAIVAVLVSAPFAARVFDEVEPFDISDPDSEVQRAYAAYEEATGARSGAEVLLLVEPADGVAGERRVAEVAEELAAVDGVATVSTPRERAAQTSTNGRAALVSGFLEAGAERVTAGELVEERFADDPDVLAGGVAVAAAQISEQTETDTRRIELYAAPLLLLLLLLVFRSPIAAALPLILAGVSIVTTLALLAALSNVVDIDLFSLQVVTALGVGLAIDYSLFVLARYRTELRAGKGYETAHRRTVATAGRTVAFGALTVAAALAALALFPQQFLSSTGIAGGIVALLSGATALLVLPALLTMLGPRIDPGFETARTPADAPVDPLSGGSRFWSRLTARVMAWPIPVLGVGLALMLAVGSPALGGSVTTPDARVLGEDQSARVVADAVTSRFPDLPANQITVIAPPGSGKGELKRVRDELTRLEAIPTFTATARLANGSFYLAALSPADPLSDEGQDLLETVRAANWPAGTLVGGRSAELADQRSSISENSGPVIAVVVATNLLLVLIMVRSLVLPFVSLLLNALTVLASYGIMVALFENQTTAELLGAAVQDGVDVSVPILTFAVVFGLSTDYGIFLFSRIAEARQAGVTEQRAITIGLARTGRLITSAAVIFAVAVGANIFSDLVIVKEFAVAVSIAVLLDATIVRGMLVPSILRLLGRGAWWWPGAERRRVG